MVASSPVTLALKQKWQERDLRRGSHDAVPSLQGTSPATSGLALNLLIWTGQCALKRQAPGLLF